MLPHARTRRSRVAVAITPTLERSSNEQGAFDARRKIDEFVGD
jgi:hypothetical protein